MSVEIIRTKNKKSKAHITEKKLPGLLVTVDYIINRFLNM